MMFGSYVIAESAGKRLAHRVCPDPDHAPGGEWRWLGFRIEPGGDLLSFPLALWFPVRTADGLLPRIRECVAFFPEMAINQDGSVIVRRAGLPPCLFVDRFCRLSGETLEYDQGQTHCFLDSLEGVRYEFSLYGGTPDLSSVTFPNGVKYSVSYDGFSVTFVAFGGALRADVDLLDSRTVGSVTYKATVGGVQRTLFSMAYDQTATDPGLYSYQCQIALPDGSPDSFRLNLLCDSHWWGDGWVSAAIPGYGSPGNYEFVDSEDAAPFVADSYVHDRAPRRRISVCFPLEGLSDPFLSTGSSGSDPDALHAFSAAPGSGDLIAEFSMGEGVCSGSLYDSSGRVSESVSGVPFAPHPVGRSAILSNPIFESGSQGWALTGQASLSYVDSLLDLQDPISLWPVSRPEDERRCVLLPPGSSLQRHALTAALLSDAPYAFCVLLAADAATCSSAGTLELRAAITINGGTTVQRSVALGKGSLCPGFPCLAFLDMSVPGGATGFSVELENLGTGNVAVGMASLFPIPVSHASYDQTTGLATETTSGTSFAKNEYEDGLSLRSIGDLSTPLSAYDSDRKPIRFYSPDGVSRTVAYEANSCRKVRDSSLFPPSGLSESLFSYQGPWGAPSIEKGAYGTEVERAFAFDGSVASEASLGTTVAPTFGPLRRVSSLQFSNGPSSTKHLAAYSGAQRTLSVDQAAYPSLTSAASDDGYGNVTLSTAGEQTEFAWTAPERPSSLDYGEGGKASFTYGEFAPFLLEAVSRETASAQIDTATLAHQWSGDVLLSAGAHSSASVSEPSLFRVSESFKLSGDEYLSAVCASDPTFGGGSSILKPHGLGESRSVSIPQRRCASRDWPSIHAEFASAGSTAGDLFSQIASGAAQQNESLVDGVAAETSSAVFQKQKSTALTLTFAALVKLGGQTLELTLASGQSTYQAMRYHNGTLYADDGSYSVQTALTGWHCVALALGSDGRGTLFVDDAAVSLFAGFPVKSALLSASGPIPHSVPLQASSKWSSDKLRRAVNDCLCVPMPESVHSRSSASMHAAAPSLSGVRLCTFDGTVLLGDLVPSSLGGKRLIGPATGLSSSLGGPSRAPRFRFDGAIGREAWLCSGDLLSYGFQGRTLSLRVMAKPSFQFQGNSRRYLFHIPSPGGTALGLYMLGTRLRLETPGGVDEDTGIDLPVGAWTAVCLRFATAVSPLSSDPSFSISYGVSAGGSPFSNSRTSTSSIPNPFRLYVGRIATEEGAASLPFLGLLSDLWVSDRDLTLQSISSLPTDLKLSRHEARFDLLGRPFSSSVEVGGSPFLTESVAFEAPTRDLGDGSGPKARQTANPVSRTVSILNQTLLSETVGRDQNGRVSSLFGQTVEYDGFGFLRKAMGEEVEYLPGGAISKRKIGQTTRTYTYDSSGRLTSVSGMCSLSYPQGSPFPSSLYRISDGYGLTFSYFAGGKVRSVNRSQYGECTFEYDASGRRCAKVYPDGHRKLYAYDGDRLVYESVPGSWAITYSYDPLGRPCRMDHFDATGVKSYVLVCDCIGALSKAVALDGTVAVSYSHGAFGTPSVSDYSGYSLTTRSSLRYKGYVYDSESGLYFLGFRLYDPRIGRFLSPDSPGNADFSSPGGLDLCAYCLNDPIGCADPGGDFPLTLGLLLLGFGIGAALGAGASVVTQGLTRGWDSINGLQVLLDAAIGGISGMFSFSGLCRFGMAIANGALGFAGSVGGDLIANGGDWLGVNFAKAGVMAGLNFLLGAASGPGVMNKKALGKGLSQALAGTPSYKAIVTACIRDGTGSGLKKTWNLYGNQLLFNAAMVLPGIIWTRTINSTATMVSTSMAMMFFNWGAASCFGWW